MFSVPLYLPLCRTRARPRTPSHLALVNFKLSPRAHRTIHGGATKVPRQSLPRSWLCCGGRCRRRARLKQAPRATGMTGRISVCSLRNGTSSRSSLVSPCSFTHAPSRVSSQLSLSLSLSPSSASTSRRDKRAQGNPHTKYIKPVERFRNQLVCLNSGAFRFERTSTDFSNFDQNESSLAHKFLFPVNERNTESKFATG